MESGRAEAKGVQSGLGESANTLEYFKDVTNCDIPNICATLKTSYVSPFDSASLRVNFLLSPPH